MKKAMGYAAHGILKVERGEPTRPNEGLRWWLDPKASRMAPTAMMTQWRGTYDGGVSWPPAMSGASKNKRTPSRSPAGSRGSKHGRSESPGRASGASGLSGKDRKRKSEGELMSILEVARVNHETHDPPMTSLTVDDFKDMMGMATRVYKDVGEPQMWFCPGPTPGYTRFRAQTSTLNVAKILLLKSMNCGFHNLWAACMEGKPARDVNKMLGGELKELIEASEAGLCVTHYEATRTRQRHREGAPVAMRICKYELGRSSCRDEDDCPFLHAKYEQNLTNYDRLFTNF